tara:strand:+ start:2026 stop:2535 length:510 start_codon:yes stop_codon:yes gene_type:complete
MIDRAYVLTMARYNAWQNLQLIDIIAGMDDAALVEDRGAFFGSILGTLNHLLWGDTLWMSRWCDDVLAPDVGIPHSLALTTSAQEWITGRQALDGRIMLWADAVGDADLQGDLTWYSGAAERQVTKSMSVCTTHLFNHQTHHRGQVHAMLTAAGQKAPTSDLVFMPEEL